MPISTYSQAAGDAFRSIGRFRHAAWSRPTVKLGVTGLARSGKTVFITALVHNLMAGARLPVFRRRRARAPGARLSRAAARRRSCRASHSRSISPTSPATRRAGRRARAASASSDSPSNMPRPNSGSGSSAARACISTSSTIPANGCSICRCSSSTIATGRAPRSNRARRRAARKLPSLWHASLGLVDPADPADEAVAERLSDLFKAYLRETPRRPARAVDAAARPLPHAGRSCRLACAHLRPARCQGHASSFPAARCGR